MRERSTPTQHIDRQASKPVASQIITDKLAAVKPGGVKLRRDACYVVGLVGKMTYSYVGCASLYVRFRAARHSEQQPRKENNEAEAKTHREKMRILVLNDDQKLNESWMLRSRASHDSLHSTFTGFPEHWQAIYIVQ